MKYLIKKTLKILGWKLIKTRKPPKPNPYGKIDIDVLNAFNECNGIFHLGAHRGVEAEVYNWFGKNTVWVEAMPEMYEILKENLSNFTNQIPLKAVLSDKDDETINFNISNHDAACSSMFSFSNEIDYSDVWSARSYKMIKTIKLKTKKIDTLFIENKLKPSDYNHWVLDLQGAELKALIGAEKALEECKSLWIEVSKKRFYNDGCTWDEVKDWLSKKNFVPTRDLIKDEDDILFLRK
tara:strand:- start:767 stop:1480 length:714 start_codon:yes stop_codon:yes gene_type:complete